MKGSAPDRIGGIPESNEPRNRDGPDTEEGGQQDDADDSPASLGTSDVEREERRATSEVNLDTSGTPAYLDARYKQMMTCLSSLVAERENGTPQLETGALEAASEREFSRNEKIAREGYSGFLHEWEPRSGIDADRMRIVSLKEGPSMEGWIV